MNTLVCTKCGESKDETLFPVNRSRRSGRGSWCKQCVAAGVSAYQRTAAGKAKIAARRASAAQPRLRLEVGTTATSPCPLFLGDTLVGYVDAQFAASVKAAKF